MNKYGKMPMNELKDQQKKFSETFSVVTVLRQEFSDKDKNKK